MVAKASKGDPFNPIAFGIPLLVIGVVLCATGILIGPGLGVIGIGVLMVLYGLVVSLFTRRGRAKEATSRSPIMVFPSAGVYCAPGPQLDNLTSAEAETLRRGR